MVDPSQKPKETRPLTPPEVQRLPPLEPPPPVDDALPWVIEFRIIGTADTIQVQVSETMLIGRDDPVKGIHPAIDLGKYGGHTKGVSRQHAELLVKDKRIRVRDLGSVNGSQLNGHVLEPNKEYRLRHGDELEIGQMRLQVRFVVVPVLGANDTMMGAPIRDVIAPIGAGQQILVVEDDTSVARVFQLALKHAGFEVHVITNGAAALTRLSQSMPAIVILDLMLPDMNGHDLVRLLRREEGGERVGVIVCSGATGGFQSGKAAEAGADSFLGKPVSVEQLLQAVGELIQRPHA